MKFNRFLKFFIVNLAYWTLGVSISLLLSAAVYTKYIRPHIFIGTPPKTDFYQNIMIWSSLWAIVALAFIAGRGARWKAELDGDDTQESSGAL